MMRLLLGLVVMLMTMTSAYATVSCQSGTGTGEGSLLGTGMCVACESQTWPNDTTYNLFPDATPGSCTDSNIANGTYTVQYWQMTAHIAGYSGDGIHDCPNMLNCDIANGHSTPDLTVGGTYSCTGSTLFPQITTWGTAFTSYDNTAFPPEELGYYTNPAPNVAQCSKYNGGMNCERWSQWRINPGTPQSCIDGSYGAADAAVVEHLEREDIGFAGHDFHNEDYCTPLNVGTSDSDSGGHGSGGSPPGQGGLLCGAGYSDNTTKITTLDRYGNTLPQPGLTLPASWDFLPLQNNITNTMIVDAPAEIYCTTPLGDTTVNSTSHAWIPQLAADASGDYPVFVDAAWQTNPSGSHRYDQQFLADIYITYGGGNKGWPKCTLEYDARLNPCPSNVCPCSGSNCTAS